jgi:transposase
MVSCHMYYKIHELKTLGYSERRTARELGIDRATAKKYRAMKEEEYLQYKEESKERGRKLDEYREDIINKITTYSEIPASVIYDHFLEAAQEAGKEFEPSKRSVRLYVAELREEMGLPTMGKIRQYSEVAELLPGFQAQVDMGEQIMLDPYGKKVKIHIFAMVMSHSRKKYVCFQLKPFNGADFVMAHDMAFRYFGGRTTEIVYDQDRVLAVSENAGNVIYTETFESYREYAGFSVRLCRGYDPESKGKIEAVVKYVKHNFLKYRTFYGIDELNSSGLSWLDRTANGQKHETTKMIPSRVFMEEVKHLKPVPTLSQPVPPREAIIRQTNVVHYLQNRYEVPKGTFFPGRKARVETEGEKVRFCDAKTGELLAEHTVCQGKGRKILLPKNAARFKETKYGEIKTKVLKAFEGMTGAEEYIQRIMERFPRYIRDQLSIISKAQDDYIRDELHKALCYCIERELYSANDFRDTLVYFKANNVQPALKTVVLPAKYSNIHAQERSVDAYSTAVTGGSV